MVLLSNKYLKLCTLLLISLLSHLPILAQACTTIIVGKEAALDGKIIIARTSDTIDARRTKQLKLYKDDKGQIMYMGLPYSDLVHNSQWDMAQVATNRFGVAISATETIQSNTEALEVDPPTHEKSGIAEPNIPALLMPKVHSAAEAVSVLGQLIETRGVYSHKGFGVLIADANESWYLETLSGHQWVAIKIPDNVYFVASNGPGQIQRYTPQQYDYRVSHYQGKTPWEFADAAEFSIYEDGVFNFRKTYADIANEKNPRTNYIRIAYIQHVLNPSTRPFVTGDQIPNEFPMFLKPEHKISVQEIEAIQRSHYEEFPEIDPYQYSQKEESVRPYYYPVSNVRTSNGHVTVVGKPLNQQDNALASVEYIAFGMPTVSFYLPIYWGISFIPNALGASSDIADDTSLFWQFRKLQALVFLSDANKGIPYEFHHRIRVVQQSYATLENEITQAQQQLIMDYAIDRDPTKIDTFLKNTVESVFKTNQYLIQFFMDSLSIDAHYGLKTAAMRNQWFMSLIRQQDCNYREDHCQTLSMNPQLASGFMLRALKKSKQNNWQNNSDRYIDAPIN